jgi:Na+/melibiose symporter-like transporter
MTGGGGLTTAPVRRRLWSDRDFTIFWCGQTLSELGNSFALVALPLLVLAATGSIVHMGLLTAVATVGSICTGLFAGGLVDRWDRRRLMIACDLARIALFGAIPVCWAAVGPQIWLLYVVMALASVFNMTFKITYVTAVAVDAATFAASAAALALIRFRRRPDTTTDRQPEDGRLWQGFRTGLAFLWRTPVLRALTILLTVVTFLHLGITDVVIFQLRHGLGEEQGVVGVVLGVAGIGTVLAAALTPLLRRRLGFGVRGPLLGAGVVFGVVVVVGSFTAVRQRHPERSREALGV